MALYYNISKIYEQKQNNVDEVKRYVAYFVLLAETKLLKLEKAISKKKYDKVLKHVSKLKKFLILFEIDECLEYTQVLSIWVDSQGSKKSIEEVFKVYKMRIEKALKELKKDYKIVIPIS